MDRVRVGFVGAGWIASRHIGNCLGFADVDVVAVTDPVRERAQEQAVRCGAAVYTDHEAMLDKEQLDALYICVPLFAHGPVELAAVDRRLPFFVEKPLATTVATAQTIADGVAANNLITAVGYHWRYLETTEAVQELLSKNPARLALGYWLDFTPPPAWWSRQAQSGGQMVEQTTHLFDLARVMLADVTEIYAAGARLDRPAHPDADVWDVSVATLHFASGALGTMASTCLLNWPHRIGLHLFCEGMAIELSEFELMVDVGQGRPVRRAEGDPFIREDRTFIDAVQGKTNQIRAPYHEALTSFQLTLAANQSVQEGRPLDLHKVSL